MQRLRSWLTLHGPASTTALLVIIAIALGFSITKTRGISESESTAHIGIEHTEPLTLGITQKEQAGRAIIDIENSGNETVFVSIPDQWNMREVHGAPLKTMKEEEPSFGFIRWQFPPNVTVSFLAPLAPESLVLHNPSHIPIKVDVTTLDGTKNTGQRFVVLVQSSPVKIW
ncbi:hypothetical protein A2635_02630 [Candidatus Peribacteria bacterium RIFCSPHIGHO2_01_FULL_51_9]|nr:MAG: hypothetical protein A2635_02630 [Candidatus Peribacteria bacterium RIFCSPHIGHO2_01_FULL_51_9]